jgi:hypothetical protein
MTNYIIALTGIVGLIGVGVAIWSIIDTRNEYYKEYIDRKKI